MASIPSSLDPGDIHVFLCVPGDQDEEDLAGAWAALDGHARMRAQRFVFPADRAAFEVAHGLLRAVLARHARVNPDTLRFRSMPYGRPELDEPLGPETLRFSLTHTRDLVACAVTVGADIGLDVERVRDEPLDVADRFFSPLERDALAALPPPQRTEQFFALWTLKEAYLKALGVGLTMPLRSFTIERDAGDRARLVLPEGRSSGSWALRSWRFPQHWGALAIRCDSNDLRTKLFDSLHIKELIHRA